MTNCIIEKMHHRKLLLDLVQKLTGSDLEEMVFYCEPLLSESTAEGTSTAMALFRELEHRACLGPHHYDFLRECLLSVGRRDLADTLPNASLPKMLSGLNLEGGEEEREGERERVGELASSPKKTLLHISRQLRRGDLERMSYLCSCEVREGLHLIQTLERNGHIRDGHYDYLREALETIGRHDLGNLLK